MRVSIRCEGSASLGLGHVRRCQLLANELHALGAKVSFLSRTAAMLGHELSGSRHQVIDISGLDEAAEVEVIKAASDLCVIDLLGDTEPLQQSLCRVGLKFLVIDGSGRVPCWGRWLVDPYPVSRQEQFDRNLRRIGDTEYLGGADFALYSALPGPLPEQQDNLVVVCMGGGDDRGSAELILRGLEKVDQHLEVLVYTGGLNPHIAGIRQSAEQSSHEVKLLLNETLLQLGTSRARFGFSAGGVTCYEMASMGLVLLTLPFVENQRRAARAWEEVGAGTFIGEAEEVSPEAIAEVLSYWLKESDHAREVSRRSRERFRGCGAGRIALALRNELCSGQR